MSGRGDGRRNGTLLAALLAALAVGGGLLFGQPQVLTIASAGLFGKVSRPAVRFPHQLHVSGGMSCAGCHHHAAAGEPPRQCASCHTGARGIRNAFHRSCVGCHDARRSRGTVSGPRLCAQCHPLRSGGNEAESGLPDAGTGSTTGK
jgi:hypothetical protein